MILHVEQKVALTLEGRRLTDDLGENIRTVVLRSNLGWEDLSFGLSLLNESCLVLSMEITLSRLTLPVTLGGALSSGAPRYVLSVKC